MLIIPRKHHVKYDINTTYGIGVKKLENRFQLAKHLGITSCHRKHLLSSERLLIIGSISYHQEYLLSSKRPLLKGSSSYHREYFSSSERLLVIGSTSYHRRDLLLSIVIFVRLGTPSKSPVDKAAKVGVQVPANVKALFCFS